MTGQDRLGRVGGQLGLGLLFAFLLVFWAVKVGERGGGRGAAYWQFDLVAGLVVAVLALLRRRDRVRLAAAGLGVAAAAVLIARFAHLAGEPAPAMAVGLAVLVASAVRHRPVRPALIFSAAGFVVALSSFLTAAPTSYTDVPAATALNMTTWLAAMALGWGARLRAARGRAMTERVRRAERLDLARELHDVVAHHITGIVVAAQAARLVAARHPERLDGSLAGIEAAGSEALIAMRRVVGLLRDTTDAAPASPGPENLTDLVDRFAGQGQRVELTLPDGELDGPPEVTSTVYRVVQEALTNIARHAPQAGSVTVRVGRKPRAVTVEITDDAPAPARPHLRAGYGLVGMRERVEALGGTLRAGPRAEAGWSVSATLPMERA